MPANSSRALTGSGRTTIEAGKELRLGYADVSSIYSGHLAGDTLVKIGTGDVNLSGNASSLASLIVSNGSLTLSGGSITNYNLQVISGVGFTHNAGVLIVAGAAGISNGLDYIVGDGTSSAALRVLSGGTAATQRDLILTNNGALQGTGTVQVNGGNGSVIVQSGGVVAPGNSGIGSLTVVGTNLLQSSGRYQWEINDFTGSQGTNPGWDWWNVLGVLSNNATTLNPFVIDITSLAGNTPGQAANFDADADYALTIATATTVANFDPTLYSLTTANFQNAYDGIFALNLVGGTNLVLNYNGMTNFVWKNTDGQFSTAARWLDNVAPPTAISNVVLWFGGIGSQQYTATNDLTGLLSKRIVLTNNSTAAQYLIGNSLTMVGGAEIRQNGGGVIVISNDLTLGANTLVTGTGTGRLQFAGVVNGTYSLTKTGAYQLVMERNNTYSGGTIVDGGTLSLAHNNAVSSSTQLLINALGTVVADGGAPTVQHLSGAGKLILSNGAAVTVNNTGASSTFTGVISGDGSLTKSGGSTLTLSTIQTYRGDTIVNGGTLQLDGRIASTNLAVNVGTFNWNNVLAMTNASALTVAAGGARINFQQSGTIATLSGTGLTVVDSGRELRVGATDASSSYGGQLIGATVLKIGTGAWNLSGTGNSISTLIVSNGTLAINGGATTSATLRVASGSTLTLNAGALIVNTLASLSNGQNFIVGNGTSAATLRLAGAAHLERDLIVTNNGVLSGSGTIVVAGGAGNVIIQNGGTQAPGNSPGTQTVVGTNLWQAGGSYQWEINDFAGSKGSNPGWDWLNVLGVLTNDATLLNPFVIDITSLNGTVAGQAANFNNNNSYSNIIATATTVANFNPAVFTLSTANFQNPFDGVFSLSLENGTNVVLSYSGAENYTWTDVTGSFSANGNWRDGSAPPILQTNVVLYFGGSTPVAYTADNDLVNLLVKRIYLTNVTAAVQTITGNSLTLAGLAPELDQNGSGAFVISNDLVLATNTLVAGTGSGTLTLAGSLSGAASLTKTGAYTLVLGGSNTYSGVTTVRDGRLQLADVEALGGSTLSNLVPGAVEFNGITAAHFGGLAGSVDLGLTNTTGGAVELTVGANNAPNTYSGLMSGSGAFAKIGSGTQTLTANSTYTGGTVVNAGTLIAGSLNSGIAGGASSIGTGNVRLNGGTLRFGLGSLLRVTNTVPGLVTFNGGTLAASEFVNLGHVNSLANSNWITSDVSNTGYLDATGGVLVVLGDIDNSGVITNGAGGILQAGSTADRMVTNSGTIALAGGQLKAAALTNTGTVVGYGILSASLANATIVEATNGMLWLNGRATGAGTYRAAPGATLTFNGGGTISSLFNTGGTIRVNGGALTNDTIFNNAGTLAMSGGSYVTSTRLTNGPTAWITGFGTISSAATLFNRGTIYAQGASPLIIDSALFNTGQVIASSGSLVVNGVFTNRGTLNFINSLGTFNSAVVNQSAWITTNGGASLFEDNLLVTSNGYINAQYYGTFRFRGDLHNLSTNKLAWNTLDLTPGAVPGSGDRFIFSGSDVTQTQIFAHPGLLLTGGFVGSPIPLTTGYQDITSYTAVTGFTNNFALGQLWVTNTTLTLQQAVPGGPTGALFVNDLYLFGSAQLVISNNMRLYFVNSNNWTLANITLLGNAEIHQLNPVAVVLSVVPEPNVLVLWLSGLATLIAARRRARRR